MSKNKQPKTYVDADDDVVVRHNRRPNRTNPFHSFLPEDENGQNLRHGCGSEEPVQPICNS